MQSYVSRTVGSLSSAWRGKIRPRLSTRNFQGGLHVYKTVCFRMREQAMKSISHNRLANLDPVMSDEEQQIKCGPTDWFEWSWVLWVDGGKTPRWAAPMLSCCLSGELQLWRPRRFCNDPLALCQEHRGIPVESPAYQAPSHVAGRSSQPASLPATVRHGKSFGYGGSTS